MGMMKTSIGLFDPEMSVAIQKCPFYSGTLYCLLHLKIMHRYKDGVLPVFAMYRGIFGNVCRTLSQMSEIS